MSLTSATTVTGGTISVTGGSTLNWTSLGLQGNKQSLVVSTDTDLRLRRSLDLTVKPPSVLVTAPNGYTQARVEAVYKQPKLLANGKIAVNTVRLTFAYDVESTATDIQNMIDQASQALFDADFVPTYKTLSLT